MLGGLESFLLQAGGGAILGFLVGYSLKKFLKLLAALVGALLLILLGLRWAGLIEFRPGALESLAEGAASGLGELVGWLSGRGGDVWSALSSSGIPLVGGVLAGALVGLRAG